MGIVVTLGGVTVGLGILARTLIEWWPGVKALRGSHAMHALAPLLPFVWGFLYGVLLPLTLGGIVYWTGWGLVWLMNWLGDVALWAGVGSEWSTPAVRASAVKLTATANAGMLLLTLVNLALVKKGHKTVGTGALCGLCLGLTSGVAGKMAVPLAGAMDSAATALYGAFQ